MTSRAHENGIGIPERPPVGQRPLRTKEPFGSVRKPLKRSASKRQKMSADAKVQDAMLGKGRCWLTDSGVGTCTDGQTQRSHIVKQTAIADAFPDGAYRFGEKFYPLEPDIFPAMDWSETRDLQSILDDPRNIVPTCPNHNVDGAAMVDALEVVGKPEGFDDFKAEYGFEFIDNRYWARVVA